MPDWANQILPYLPKAGAVAIAVYAILGGNLAPLWAKVKAALTPGPVKPAGGAVDLLDQLAVLSLKLAAKQRDEALGYLDALRGTFDAG